ncbi:MAG: cytochrome c maturation protein CcmE [Coriobacteriia bacterium]|nr:cytochrome c maturation protein CcmE [Coriobacteriia bacterium]
MNKRARTRLIGVTAIILVAVAALVFGTGKTDAARSTSVAEIAGDPALVGERVKVSGTVVSGSWNKRSHPMEFEVREEKDEGGPTLRVVYDGRVPDTFGDNVTAIVTGELQAGGTVQASNLTVKCPSKYESETGALSVARLLETEDEMVGKATRVTGVVVGPPTGPASVVRLRIRDAEGAGEIPVAFDGGLPESVKDGAKVVLGGSLDDAGVFDATSVSLTGSE